MRALPKQQMSALWFTLGLMTRPTALFRGQAQRYGDTFEQRLLGLAPTVVVTRPEDIKVLFTAPPEEMPNGNQSTAIGPICGKSVLTMQGEGHLRRRKMLLPFFHGDRMQAWGPHVEGLMHERIDSWHAGDVIRMHDEMQAVTLDTILLIVFGIDDAERHAEMHRVVLAFSQRLIGGRRAITDAVFAARGRMVGAMRQLSDALDALVYAEIASHRQRGDLETRTDIMSQLMLARDEHGAPLTDEELRDELVTQLLVGFETTGTSLAWAMERLARNPDVIARATAERAGADGGAAYITALVYETLRDRPVIPMISRTPQKPVTLDGVEIAAGTVINANIYLVNHRADVYEDPYRFFPDRFLNTRPSTYAWIPFGGGIRRCLGGAFAEQQMRSVLGVVLSRVTFEAVDKRAERSVFRAVTFAPHAGAKVRVTAVVPRSEVAAA